MKAVIVIELFDNQFRPLGFLKAYDPDVGTDTVTGDVTSTLDIHEAKLFDLMADAIAFAMQQSTRVPFRPDGQPNRPLMAFTMEFKSVTTQERQSEEAKEN